MSTPMILLGALFLDALFGEPRVIWSRLPHPAVLIGRAIGWADRRFNKGAARRLKGTALVAVLVLASLALGAVVNALPGSDLWTLLIAAILLAQRSLCQHVAQVADALRLSTGNGRRKVAMIVGRDTSAIDGPAIARGAIESAAENLSDGVIAPAFWFLIGGLPGLLAYKAINTADSMIGYLTPRHSDFGWAAARLDDLVNWIPARLTAALTLSVMALQRRPLPGFTAFRADAGKHRSPNAGWPEAAFARALGVALAGPRSYSGEKKHFPFVNPDGRREATARDIDAAVTLLWQTWGMAVAVIVLVACLA